MSGEAAVTVDFPIYDADQHYYEAADTYTRHLDPKYSYAFRWVQTPDKRRTHLLIGGQLQTMIPNPTFDPVAHPGALAAYFRGENTEGMDIKKMVGQTDPIDSHPEYRDRAKRAEVLSSQGVAGAFMLPTLGLGIEELLNQDVPALYAVLHAGNEWIEEEWGFARDNQIIAPPVISLVDPERAEQELQWAIERGTKAVAFRPGPVAGLFGYRSPADPMYDRFYSMCEEADVAIAIHAGDAGYASYTERWGERVQFSTYNESPFTEVLSVHLERPIFEMLAAMICHGLFDRHPRLKVVTIELGSGWVPELLRRFRITYGKIPYTFKKDPVETFHQNIWVTPFQEDSVASLLDHMRVDRILFGSDWPHPEGIANPADFVQDIATLTPADRKKVMSDNMRDLLSLA